MKMQSYGAPWSNFITEHCFSTWTEAYTQTFTTEAVVKTKGRGRVRCIGGITGGGLID